MEARRSEMTIRVRIAVAVAPNGQWAAGGWNSWEDQTRIDDYDLASSAIEGTDSDNARITWVEADVLLPPPEETVKGEVVS